MVRDGAFDAGELAIVTYLQAKCYGKPLTLLPATMVGRFQHRGIAYDASRGELKPKDLEGKKVGVRSYSQTTGVWIRGILQHQFGVDLNKVTWAAHDDPHVAEALDPAFVERFELGGKTLAELLAEGRFDAAILGGEMPKSGPIKPLIPDPEAAALEWHKKNGTTQINHMFVMSSKIARARPDVVLDVYQLLLESKKLAGEPKGDIDLLPFGFEAVSKSLALAAQYAFEQKLIPRKISVDELFDETTRAIK